MKENILRRVPLPMLLAAALALFAGRAYAEPIAYAQTEAGYILLTQRQDKECGEDAIAYATSKKLTDKGCWHYDGKYIVVSWQHGPKKVKYDSSYFVFVPDVKA